MTEVKERDVAMGEARGCITNALEQIDSSYDGYNTEYSTLQATRASAYAMCAIAKILYEVTYGDLFLKVD